MAVGEGGVESRGEVGGNEEPTFDVYRDRFCLDQNDEEEQVDGVEGDAVGMRDAGREAATYRQVSTATTTTASGIQVETVVRVRLRENVNIVHTVSEEHDESGDQCMCSIM